MQFAPSLLDDETPPNVGGLVETIAPGVQSKPELYALVALAVLAYKHRARITGTFGGFMGRIRGGR